MVLCTYNPSPPEAERQEDYELEAFLGYTKSQANLSYLMRPCLKNKTRVKTKQKSRGFGLWV